jgi:NAD-dependent DNA ligase
MEPVNSSTPAWLVGLLIVFALAAAATFGLLLWRHAEINGLTEQWVLLTQRAAVLEDTASKLEHIPIDAGGLDQQIRERRDKVQQLGDIDKTTAGDVDRLIARNQDSVRANEESQNKEVGRYRDLMKEASDRRSELGKEEEGMYATERENDERRRQMRDDIERKSVLIEQKKKEARQDNAKNDGRIAELEARVEQLTQEQDISKRMIKSDGQIVASESANGFVVINRGHRQNLRNGTKFKIFNVRGGHIVFKGDVQVINVEEEISTARVISEYDSNDPLIVGDQLHNPVYDPDKTKHFAIRGDFMRFSKEELAEFIKDSGGVVDPGITIQTDYLVAGGNSQKALDQATKLGVSILSEDQLLDFVRLKPRLSSVAGFEAVRKAAAQGRTFAIVGKFTTADEGLIKKYISNKGGKTTGSVGKGVDFVIAGDHAEDEITKARELKIPVIDQSQFSHLNAENTK